jgi:hypothetical protein
MGEAKRRKLLDPNFGKTKIPTTVPEDYLKFANFKPCFGYYYCVHFKDDNPAFFDTNKEVIMLLQEQKLITFSFGVSYGSDYLVTVEVKRKSNLGMALMKTMRDPSESRLRFVVRPNVKGIFKDKHGLKVLPFDLLSLNSEEEYHKDCARQSRQARHFFV